MASRAFTSALLLVALVQSILIASVCSSSRVCADSRAVMILGKPLSFCGHSGASCCDAVDDDELKKGFDGLQIVGGTCAAAVKAVLCARCTPYLSSVLSNSNTGDTMKLLAPLLCVSTSSSTSLQHPSPTATTRSPHQQQQDTTMCLERITTGYYLTMAAHPDGSGRAFLSTQDGKIWLVALPRPGSFMLRGRHPFLDLTDRVRYDAAFGFGLKGVAFHPDFATNGRFFVSYSGAAGNCWSDAASAVGNGSQPSCRYKLVVTEFSTKGRARVEDHHNHKAAPSEVGSIFTMLLPRPHRHYSYQQHGGQLLFKPRESYGYLYLVTGHGAYEDDTRGRPADSSNSKSLVSKIIRIDIDGSTPKMEIFAMGMSNPSGCSFNAERPANLYCANVDEQLYERVSLISKGGDYGGSSSAAVPLAINHGRPAVGRMPSIVGGLVYRGSADPALNERYVYMYASGVWTSCMVGPPGCMTNDRRHATAQLVTNVSCSGSSPLPCHRNGITGRVLSLGEDNNKDLFFLATGGVYRVVPPSLCKVPPQVSQGPAGMAWAPSLWTFALAFAISIIFSTICGGRQTVSLFNGFCPSLQVCVNYNRHVRANNFARADHEE